MFTSVHGFSTSSLQHDFRTKAVIKMSTFMFSRVDSKFCESIKTAFSAVFVYFSSLFYSIYAPQNF